MMRFMWDPKYSVNIKSIDAQHQKFFEIINEIYYAIGSHQVNHDQLIKVITELSNYAQNHFAFEEKYFEEYSYDEAAAHLAAHNLFRDQIKKYFDQVSASSEDLTPIAQEIAEFSQNWLSEHILNTDHQYAGCFLAHGLK